MAVGRQAGGVCDSCLATAGLGRASVSVAAVPVALAVQPKEEKWLVFLEEKVLFKNISDLKLVKWKRMYHYVSEMNPDWCF